MITKLRVIKSNEELIYVKQAAELADRALDEAWKYTKAGANEAKILAEIKEQFLKVVVIILLTNISLAQEITLYSADIRLKKETYQIQIN